VLSSNATDPQSAASSDLRGLRVLVVEDSWHVARALKSILEDLRMQVAGPAATLAEAERLVAAQIPEVAIVDIQSQGRDGLRVDRSPA